MTDFQRRTFRQPEPEPADPEPVGWAGHMRRAGEKSESARWTAKHNASKNAPAPTPLPADFADRPRIRDDPNVGSQIKLIRVRRQLDAEIAAQADADNSTAGEKQS